MNITTVAAIRAMLLKTERSTLINNMSMHQRGIYDDIMYPYGLGADIEVPIIPDLFTRIKQQLDTSSDTGLDMQAWHTCGSVHCLAGWMIHLAPYRTGYALVDAVGDEMSMPGEGVAGMLIFLASCPWSAKDWPYFFPLEYPCSLSIINNLAREYVNTMAAKEQAMKQEGVPSDSSTYLPNG